MASKFDGKIEQGIYFRYLRDRDGNVRKARNGKPLRTFTHRYHDVNGKERQDTYKTIEDARNAGKRDTRAAVDNGTHIDKRKGNTTLGTYVETVCLPPIQAARAANTATGYRSRWNAIRKAGPRPIEAIPLRTLTREDLQAAFSAYAPGRKARTVAQTWTILKMFLESAYIDGYTNLDPRRVRLTLPETTPGDTADVRRAVPMGEYYQVRDLAEARMPGVGDLLDIGCMAGLRSGEARAFDANRIDWQAGTYTVDAQLMGTRKNHMWLVPPKRGRTRTVPLPPGILAALKQRVTDEPPTERVMTYRRTDGTTQIRTVALIFTEPDDTPMRSRILCDILKRARTAAGVTGKLTFHTLRHTYASHLMNGGEARANTAARLGHAHPGITEAIYTHITDDDMSATLAIINTTMTRPMTRPAAPAKPSKPRSTRAA